MITGGGKGKTTAALGMALRAAGHGLRTLMIQFLKGTWPSGELEAAPRLGGLIEIRPMGRGFVAAPPAGPDPEDVRMAEEAWQAALGAMRAGNYDILILDEILYAIHFGMIPLERVLTGLAERPPWLHVVCTGRHAPAGLVEAADLVSEVREVKHPFGRGLRAQMGIDF